MSTPPEENTNGSAPDKTEIGELAEATPVTDGDFLLTMLVHIVNSGPGNSMEITLNIPGATITGTLIRNQDWLDAVGSMVSGASGVGGEGLASLFTEWHEFLNKGLLDDQKIDEHRLPGMIHLKHAKYFVGGGPIPSGQGSYWRGRISEVSGWSMGSISLA